MALQRPLSKALACSKCQRWVVRSFIFGVAGHVHHLQQQQPPPPPAPPQRRYFSRQGKRWGERQQGEEHALNDINDEVSQSQSTQPTTLSPPQPQPQPQPQPSANAQAHLPWYLQPSVQPPQQQQAPSPLLNRQTLPSLPPNPPPLLQPLMSHISTELGLDNLSLLDLRALENPPPALGSNLIMLVATARSERHLHVSADRLCRWLRSLPEAKLRPFADGLLGRNELKLKLRRRAKRRRLLGGVGVKGTAGGGREGGGEEEVDDGIRTGWVCVHVGRVPMTPPKLDGARQEVEVGRQDGIVGFGHGKEGEGCSVVVQMMTEEKRAEVDLEGLWGGVLEKAGRETEKLVVVEVEKGADVDAAASAAAAGDGLASEVTPPQRQQEEDIVHRASPPPTQTQGYHPSQRLSTHAGSAAQQMRNHHTSARLLQASTPLSFDFALEEVVPALPHSPSPTTPARTTADDESIAVLNALVAKLKAHPRKGGLELLGPNLLPPPDAVRKPNTASTNTHRQPALSPANPPAPVPSSSVSPSSSSEDEEITPFLHTFRTHLPTSPTPSHWHTYLTLLVHARKLGHPQLHSPALVAQLNQMLLAGLIPQERTFFLVLDAILSPLGEGVVRAYDGVEREPSEGKLRLVLGVLEMMEGCGYNALSVEVLGMVRRVCLGVAAPTSPAGVGWAREGLEGLEELVPLLRVARLKRLVRSGDWWAFWREWRGYPHRFLPRTSGMYAVVFAAIAEGKMSGDSSSPEATYGTGMFSSGGISQPREVLGALVEEMGMEEPVIRIEGDEELAGALKGAMEGLVPELKEVAGEGQAPGTGGGEWAALYRRCKRVLGQV